MKVIFAVQLEVAAESEQEARQKFAEMIASAIIQPSTYEQVDGSFKEYAPPPTGYKVVEVNSVYFGSEDWDDNRLVYFGVPEETVVPKLKLCHGKSGQDQWGFHLLPSNTFKWNGHEWVAFETPGPSKWFENEPEEENQ
jgi:hypothetical protein